MLGFADADLFCMKVSLGVQFADGNKNVLLEALGEKLYFDLADTAEVVERISALVEGREPVVPDIAAGETYPPVEIGGLDLGAIFSLLDNFDATSILGMLADTVGVETENGYEYNVPVLGDVAVKMSVDGNNDLTSLAVTGLAAGGTEAVIELNGISYPAQKPVPVSVEGYKNVKDYLPLLENFCKEKIDSVPQLIETIKKTDFGRLVETIKAVKEAGAVSFDVALNAGVKVTAKATVDFADGLTVALKATVSGNEIEVYYADGAFYLLKEGVSLKANAEDISALAALFGADIGDIDLGGLALGSIGADNGVLQVRLGGLTLTLDVAALEAEINYNGYSAKVTGIAAGGRVNVPEIAWSELGNAVPLVENLFEKISGLTFGFSGTIDGAKKVTFTDVRVIDSGTDGIAQDFENGKISRVGVGSAAQDVLNHISFTGGAYGKVTHSDGSANDGIVGTGDVLTIYDKNGGEMARYTFVIYGDVNGDGAVTSMDLLYVKRHILGTKLLEEPYLTAADANRGNDGITSIDLLYIKRHILDIRYIEQ